jgi:hypothetical protein
MNSIGTITLATSISLASTFAISGEIPASNFFIKSDSVIKIQADPNDIVVFDEHENDKYFLEGRDMILSADNIKVIGNALIGGFRSSAPNGGGAGSPGQNGVSFGQASPCRTGSPGGNGNQGGEGPPGNYGRSGSVIKLDIGAITGPGLIKFSNTGQNGGAGGQGGRGGDGGHGEKGGQSKSTLHCECGGADGGPGGSGGPGGIGGIGGDGGNGGTIVLSARTSKVRQRLDFNVSGGKGGEGGPGGDPGNGGNGSQGGGGGGFCGGGNGAGNGPLGANGANGRTGADGRQGVIVEW